MRTIQALPNFERASRTTLHLLLAALLASLATGCSVKRMAVNNIGDALADGGTTFATDDDPELIKAAVPFSLKLMESLLNESPRHQGVLFAYLSPLTPFLPHQFK